MNDLWRVANITRSCGETPALPDTFPAATHCTRVGTSTTVSHIFTQRAQARVTHTTCKKVAKVGCVWARHKSCIITLQRVRATRGVASVGVLADCSCSCGNGVRVPHIVSCRCDATRARARSTAPPAHHWATVLPVPLRHTSTVSRRISSHVAHAAHPLRSMAACSAPTLRARALQRVREHGMGREDQACGF